MSFRDSTTMKPSVTVLRLTLVILVVFAWGCAAPKSRVPVFSSRALAREQHKQRCLFLEERISLQKRLQHTSFPVLLAAAPMTEKHRKLFGFYLVGPSLFPPEYQDAAREVFALKNGYKVSLVVEGSAAHRAGMQVDDHIVSINGLQPPYGPEDLQGYLEQHV